MADPNSQYRRMRKRKGADDYVAEYGSDFTVCPVGPAATGGEERLICRYCCLSISARTDRIKEHLSSKRHKKLKLEKEESDGALQQDNKSSTTVPDPSISNDLQMPMKQETSDGKITQVNAITQENGDREPAPRLPRWNSRNHNFYPLKPRLLQRLCIKWNNYDSTVLSTFSKFRHNPRYHDVTLWCEGKTIKCHKVILSAGSVLFENLLLAESPRSCPNIILADLHFWQVEILVDFMYRGTAIVQGEKLPEIVEAAKSLQIKGF